MKLVVGLGNPGEKYKKNRHNVGHMLIAFVNKQIGNNKFKNVQTDCYMNLSGQFVKKAISDLDIRISDLIVAHDDLDIPLGKFKIQKGKGPLLHNGISSIEKALGRSDFWRIRIGVENRDPENRVPGEKYVLSDFTPEEKEKIKEVFDKIYQRWKLQKLF